MTAATGPPIVTRLAPSPTGAQHVGNARTYLASWLLGRHAGGRVLLRVEDIDSPRIKPGAAALLAEDLRWLGLDWDNSRVVQTERLPKYEATLRRLQARELVYPCTCTRSDVEQAASAPHLDGEPPPYPGTCAGRSVADAKRLQGRPFAWRFRATEVPDFVDQFRGPVRLDPSRYGGDFVVWKSAGTPAYQLAVVVDDADQGVTDVVRGDDLIPSTPRQLLLHRALGLTPPRFCHLPLVVGSDGRRLAKRHGDTRLVSLRNAGVRAAELLGLLAWSCGWLTEPAPIKAMELIPLFRLDSIPPRPFVLEPAMLARIGYRPS